MYLYVTQPRLHTLMQRRLSAQGRKPEEAIIEGRTYIYVYTEHTVCIPDKISICSKRGRVESLGSDDVSALNARMEPLGNDDVTSQNARRYLVGNGCDVTITGGRSEYKTPYACFDFCHTSSDFKLLTLPSFFT